MNRKDYDWIIFWFLFLMWGIADWQIAELFSRAWWIDGGRHLLFGFFGALTIYHLYRRNSPQGEFHSHNPRQQKYVREFVISRIMYLGIGWEILEAVWDRLLQPNWPSWLAQAQKGSLDNTIDIVFNLISAWLAMRLYYYLHKPALQNEEMIAAEIARINADIEKVNEEISRLHKEHLHKEHWKKLRPALKSFLRTTKVFFKSLRER